MSILGGGGEISTPGLLQMFRRLPLHQVAISLTTTPISDDISIPWCENASFIYESFWDDSLEASCGGQDGCIDGRTTHIVNSQHG